jgi:hypothetical protein
MVVLVQAALRTVIGLDQPERVAFVDRDFHPEFGERSAAPGFERLRDAEGKGLRLLGNLLGREGAPLLEERPRLGRRGSFKAISTSGTPQARRTKPSGVQCSASMTAPAGRQSAAAKNARCTDCSAASATKARTRPDGMMESGDWP